MAKAESVQERLLAMEEGGLWDAVSSWLRAHQVALGSAVAVVVLLAGGSFYWRYQKAAALEGVRQGIATLQSGDAQKAVAELQKIQNSSVSHTERALGLFYLGEAYATLGKKDEAVKSYESALAAMRGDKTGAYFAQLLFVRFAQAIENAGSDDSAVQARKKYEQAAELDGPFKAEALVAAGRLAEKLNDGAAAKTHYEKLVAASASHPLAEVFQGKLGK